MFDMILDIADIALSLFIIIYIVRLQRGRKYDH